MIALEEMIELAARRAMLAGDRVVMAVTLEVLSSRNSFPAGGTTPARFLADPMS